MAKDYARSFYRSKAWQECRASFIQARVAIDGGMCQHCQQVPGFIVDHVEEITPDTIRDPWVTLSHDNLQYLCLVCHNIKHYGSPVTRQGLRFDSDGQVVRA